MISLPLKISMKKTPIAPVSPTPVPQMDDPDPIGKSRIAISEWQEFYVLKTPICRTLTLWDPLPHVPAV
jgi:hypothetical protein